MVAPGAHKGFTIIELMIIIVVLAVMAAVAVPNFNRFIDNNRTLSVNNELVSLLQYARAYAVEHRTSAHLCVSDTGAISVRRACSDANALRALSGVSGVNITVDADLPADIEFRNNGTASPVTNFISCRDGDWANGFTTTVNATGMVRTYARGQNATGAMSECSDDEEEE